jgi:hypothetical protein
MLLHPRQVFHTLLAQGNRDLSFFSMLLGGMVLCLTWADLFNLGRHYETGRIMSGALILGPVVGIVLFLLMSAFGLWLGGLLARGRKFPEGRPDFARLLGCLSKTAWIFFPLGALMGLTGFALDATGFGRVQEGTGADGFWLVLKLGFMGLFLYLWLQLLRAAFDLDWGRTSAVGLVSTGLSCGVVLFFVSFLTGIQLT